MVSSSISRQLLGSKKYAIEVTIPRFIILAQADQILGKGNDSPPGCG